MHGDGMGREMFSVMRQRSLVKDFANTAKCGLITTVMSPSGKTSTTQFFTLFINCCKSALNFVNIKDSRSQISTD